MREILKNASGGECIPVLLGASMKTYETAQDLYRRHGSVSHVFCDRIPLPFRFSICMRVHRICHTRGQRLLLQALLDFAEQLGNADVILLLIPCTEEYDLLLSKYASQLESRYVLCDSATRVMSSTGAEPKGVLPQ
ncbi:MAG: hypothetical protein IJX28_09245 [Clostridia bacterium]|nr:hypothetical protein [Clostridia bacterium]